MSPAGRAAAIALLALLTALALPSASACSIAQPHDHTVVLWAGDGVVATNEGETYGLLDLETDAYEPLATPFPLTRIALTPDGSRVVWQQGAGLGADCTPQGGRTYVRDLGGGEARELLDVGVTAHAVGPTHAILALADTNVVTLVPLDDPGERRDVPIHGARVSTVAASPQGRWFAAASPGDDSVRVIDGERAQVVATVESDDGGALAFSDSGEQLAILSTRYGERVTLRIVDAATGESLGERIIEGNVAGVGIAWRGDVLAFPVREMHYPGDGSVSTNTTLRVIAPDSLEDVVVERFTGDSSWGGVGVLDDGRVVLNVGERLRIVDPELGPSPSPTPAGPSVTPTPDDDGDPPARRFVPAPGALVPLVLAAFVLVAARRSR